MQSKLYTAQELAEMKGVQVAAVWRMIRKGRITLVNSPQGAPTNLFDEAAKEKYMAIHVGRPKWKKVAGSGDGTALTGRVGKVDAIPHRSTGKGRVGPRFAHQPACLPNGRLFLPSLAFI